LARQIIVSHCSISERKVLSDPVATYKMLSKSSSGKWAMWTVFMALMFLLVIKNSKLINPHAKYDFRYM
jgi:hypothetical protein